MKEIKLELPIVDLSGVCESMNDLKKAVEEYGKREVIVRLGTALIKSGVKCSAIIEGSDEEVILDFSEHDKMVAQEKDAQIRGLKRQIEDLEAIIADKKKPDISVSENGVSIGCECGGYHLAKERIAKFEKENAELKEILDKKSGGWGKCGFTFEEIIELQDRHQSDCIRINQLLTTIDVLTERYQKLREVHGL